MRHWNVFDAACVVGRHCRLQAGGLHTAADLLAEMDHFGIAEALVLDSLSRENHPADGNARILGVAAAAPVAGDGRRRLHPAWALLPPGTCDAQPEPDRLVDALRASGVGAVWLLPGQYRFSLSDWCLDALLEPLAEARVPVFINPNDIGPCGPGADQTDWEGVVRLCRRWPTLPVIVSEFRIRRTQRLAFRALDACENLHIELSALWLWRNIEFITRRWGAQRLVFGSGWPTCGQGMTLAHLTTAEIADADKRRIAGDNLRELLAWRKPEHPHVELTLPADTYVEFGRTGRRPAEMRFWDCHGHLGGRMSHYHVPDGSLEATVGEMERMGVERACVFSFAGITSDEAFGNDAVAEAVRRYPDRLVGLALLNPHRGRDAMLAELERCERLGLRGVKLIPHYQGYPEEGPLIDVACQWAHERRQIILNHSWGSPAQLERLITAYPDACYVTGHSTTAYAELMKRHANLYVCSCPLLGPRACEEVVAAIGADRLLFGSDLQDLPIAWGLGPVLFARIPAEHKAMILGGNLKRILDQYSRH